MAKEIPWKILSEAYAFIGNSLLKPMTMTSTVGLDPAFWEAFPSFDDEAVAEAVAACARYAEGAVQRAEAGEDEPQRAAVEYTKLFVGPPSPAAAPWGDDVPRRERDGGVRSGHVRDARVAA